jgi:hypothetical protein
MFPNSNWLERKLPTIGLWMFFGGIALLTVGSMGETLNTVASVAANGSQSPIANAFWRVLIGLANPLIYNGVVLYLIGRLIGAWSISIVGFEYSDGDALRVKGPDHQHMVWIGRKYDAVLDAEAATRALQRRFRKSGDQQ